MALKSRFAAEMASSDGDAGFPTTAGEFSWAAAMLATSSQIGVIRITVQDLIKMPFRFISSCWGFGEKRSPSALLIAPDLMSW